MKYSKIVAKDKYAFTCKLIYIFIMTFNGTKLEDNGHVLKEFSESLNSFTLNFKDSKLESKYRAGKFNPLSTFLSLKLALGILILIVLIRKFIAFGYAVHNSTSESLTYAIIEFSLLCLAITVELLALFCCRLRIAKGLVTMWYVALVVSTAGYVSAPMCFYL